MTDPTVLLTGFSPFGGAGRNPSWDAVKPLHGLCLHGHIVVARELPTEFGHSLTRLTHLVARHQPALVLCVGLAEGRKALSFERVAVNLNDARIADNVGAQPVDTPVVPGAPNALFTTLPVKAMARAVQRAGVPSELSLSAGSFVCNHVFFGLLELLSRTDSKLGAPTRPGGFVHVPSESDLPVADTRRGLQVALEEALSRLQRGLGDLKTPAGAIA
jgi:pyroglutamyl-peptidase